MGILTVMTPDLATLFDFTPDDLAANRTGALSSAQRQRLNAVLVTPPSRTLATDMLSPLLFLVGVPFLCAVLTVQQSGNAMVVAIALAIALGGAFLVIGIYQQVLRSTLKMNNLLHADLTASAVAAASLHVQYDPDGEHLHLADPAQDLWIYHESLDALPMGSQYTVYYLPNTETLLSLEES